MSDAFGNICFFYRRWLKFTKSEKTPQDVKDLFDKYKDNVRDRMSIDKLQNFLIKEKEMTKEDAITSALKIIDSRKLKGFSNLWRNSLSLSGFLHYLLSKHNLPLAKKELDEKAAFAHYFVYTSHSSYLKQNEEKKLYYNITEQGLDIASSNKKKVHSSIKAIEKALQGGVKVIELDLWLSSDKTKIYVDREGGLQSHSPVTLDKCLKTIKKNAFTTSEFPLILILVEHFDLTADETSNLRDNIKKEFSQFECLPKIDQLANRSLESLKKKIIILKRQTEQEQSSANVNEESEYISGYIEVLEDEEIQNSLKSESNKLRICSLTEKQLENRETTPNSEVTSFTQKNLLAVHPNSNLDDPVIKNYDPLIGWMHGAQMVALYMQDKCKYLWIMQGLFRAQEVDKNPTGYVKKPEILLKESPIFDPTAWRPVKKILKVKVYLGTGWHLDFGNENFDMDTPPDFFAAVEIVGVPADEAREKTVPAMDQWIPSWDQEFTFPLTVPELAMLVIEVKEFDTDRTHDFGGQTCLPVCQLERGIRSVPLYDRKGVAYRSAKLLMCFEY